MNLPVENLAAELRKLADHIEQHPPSAAEAHYRRPLPYLYSEDGAAQYIQPDGYALVDISVRW